MKTFASTLTVLALLLLASPQPAYAGSATARINNKCSPQSGTIVVPKGKKAVGFRLQQLQNGIKCRVGGKPDGKGWGIMSRGRKIYYWHQWRNKKPSEIGGPLNKLELKPGRYHVFVDGGRGAVARVSFGFAKLTF